jgi:hypothetical protein
LDKLTGFMVPMMVAHGSHTSALHHRNCQCRIPQGDFAKFAAEHSKRGLISGACHSWRHNSLERFVAKTAPMIHVNIDKVSIAVESKVISKHTPMVHLSVVRVYLHSFVL